MVLHIGEDTVVLRREVVGIFDLENTTVSKTTRDFLSAAEQRGDVVTVTDDIPRSFVVCVDGRGRTTVYLSQISCATLKSRNERKTV